MRQDAQIDHAIVDVLVVKDNKFLLVEEGKPSRKGLLNLPGGHVEADETLFDAALREVKEETGYEVELTGVIGIYQGIFPNLNVSGPVFAAKVIGGEPTPTAEHPAVHWVTKEELYDLAKDAKLFTKYPPYAVGHYSMRGVFPLSIIASYDYSK